MKLKILYPIVALGLSACSGGAPAVDEELARKGEQVFVQTCSACHSVDTAIRVGPGLEGLIGRQVGSLDGFQYSAGMKNDGGKWTQDKLEAFLQAPFEKYPDTRMVITPLPKEQAQQVSAYLSQY